MENETKKCKQKIEMKLIESEKAHSVSFSKRKKYLCQQTNKLANRFGADVGIILFQHSGNPRSTSIEEIIDNFF